MKFINLTSHNINLPNGAVIPSSGVARCSELVTPVDIWDGVPLVRREFGPVPGMPEPEEGTIYIVSSYVRMAHPERKDLASPGDPCFDGKGNRVAQTLTVN